MMQVTRVNSEVNANADRYSQTPLLALRYLTVGRTAELLRVQSAFFIVCPKAKTFDEGAGGGFIIAI